METKSLQSDSNPRRKRSFTLSSFRKPAGEQQATDTTNATAAEEVARLRKAAAWQWYTRGVGEVVVPTKRPIPGDTLTGDTAAVRRGLVHPKGGGERPIEKKCSAAAMDRPPAAGTRRAASRFKAEASARAPAPAGASATTIRAVPSPLYDEFELSSLKTQMVDFVQRLQKKESEQKAAKPLHSDPAPAAPTGNHSSRRHLHPPAKGSGARRSKSASVEGSGFRRPMSALKKLLRKVMAIPFVSKNNSGAVQEPESPPAEVAAEDMAQFHYHHYIHHHHHHYHCGGPSPEEAEFISRRRHSESSGIRPRITPSLIWEENEVTTDDKEESPLSASISRRRRHSDSVFAKYYPMKTNSYEGAEWREYKDKEPVKPAMLQLPRRYNSERYTSRSEVPNVVKDMEISEEHRQGADIKIRRRNSLESVREEGEAENVRWRMRAATEEAQVREGGGVYKLGGARSHERTRRRHSESLGVTSRSLREENVELW